MRKSVLLLLLLGTFVIAQEPQTLPDRGFHSNPSCSPRGSATSVRCGCLGMVGQVQEAIVKKCWGLVGIDEPDEILRAFPPPQVLECLSQEEQKHCQIVARYASTNEEKYGIKVKRPEHECRTSCKPENCKCGDEACPRHGEGEGY